MENPLYEKSKKLAISIIGLYQFLINGKHEFVLSKQILKSGTSVGANIREAKRPQSEADCISKLSIALKEAEETAYWLELLYESQYIDQNLYKTNYTQTEEMIKILVSVIKRKKESLTK